MGMSVTLSGLASRATRAAIAGHSGIRKFQSSANADIDRTDGSFWDSALRFGKFLVSGLITQISNFLSFSASAIWSYIWNTTTFLLNFNINATDAELDAQIKQGEIAIASATGSLKGTAVGWAVCGIVPTATLAVFNEALAVHTLARVGEEAAEELVASIGNLISLQFQQMQRNFITQTFKNHRALFRSAATGFAQLMANAGLIDQASVDKANKERNKPWSIAGTIESTAENIKDPVFKAEYEEFWDEFSDACMEAGYVVAGGIDSYFAQQGLTRITEQGDETIIELFPARRDGDED